MRFSRLAPKRFSSRLFLVTFIAGLIPIIIFTILIGSYGARIEKEITNLEKVIESSNRQLSDDTFLGKAPAKVVETVRAKLSDYQAQLAKNKKLLEGLD